MQSQAASKLSYSGRQEEETFIMNNDRASTTISTREELSKGL